MAVVGVLLLATTKATMHVGGSGGVGEALARLLGGGGTGVPGVRGGVLCRGKGARFPGTPPEAPLTS